MLSNLPIFNKSPKISINLFISLTLILVFLLYNSTFWGKAFEIFSGQPLSLFGYILAVYFLLFAIFSLFGFPWLIKAFLVFIVILSSITSYYMDNLGVIIDSDMVQNVMVTTLTEGKHLITIDFVTHVMIYGAFPALIILSVKLKKHGIVRTIATPLLTCLISTVLCVGLLLADMKSYSSILRERRDFMSSFQPGAPLVGAIRYAWIVASSTNIELNEIGEDAEKGPSYARMDKPLLTVVVAGETARAQNFSLNGYGVETNPRLAKLPIVNFTDVQSCGTATAVSLPCMFSKFTRSEYSYKAGLSHQNILDVLNRVGFHVEWWDNNTGHKNIADRVHSRSFTHEPNPEFCFARECRDGIFIEELKKYANKIKQDTVLVLHQIGSHGPTYYLRYPKEFEFFKPACKTAEFKKCTRQEITNAYDNTIIYTDEILAQAIEVLQSQDRLATSLVYVSDHGESLGENGLYLHGAPYFMAPEEQTRIPMIIWMSKSFQDAFKINQDCLAAKKDSSLSHDNLFHSLLGMLDIQTSERKAELDIFSDCKSE